MRNKIGPVSRLGVLAMALAAIAPGGCGSGGPQPAKRDAARDALRVALDAWMKGGSPDDLTQAQPPIHVSDWRWRSGVKLLRYEIDERDRALGAERRCPVQLWIDAGKGRTVRKSIAYNVGTHPALTVARAGDH
jgi:hypothetical protein